MPGEENAIPQPVAIDFGTVGECWPVRLCASAGSKPKASNPEPMVVDSGAASVAAEAECVEYTDTESIPSRFDITDSDSEEFYNDPTARVA